MEVVTKRVLHQQVKILGQFKCHVMLGSMSQKLFSLVWILFRQTSSQLGSQKLLQVLVSHELTVCLSVFKLLLTH